jgi:lipoprotein-releasing system permease protein
MSAVELQRVYRHATGDLKLPFSLFLALRYLKPKRTFLSIITLISVLGVTLGIAVLLIVISVMTGFDHELRQKVLGFEPHVVVTNNEILGNWREIMKQAQALPDVVAVAPFIQGPVIAEHEGRVIIPQMRGIDPDQEQRIVDLKSIVKSGTFDLSGDSIVIGIDLAKNLGVDVGDKITIYAPANIRGILDELKHEQANPKEKSKTLAEIKNEISLPAELTVTGIFSSGRYMYDSGILLVPLHIGQELYSLEDGVHGISIRTKEPYRAEAVKIELNRIFNHTAFAETWIDRNKELFDAIRVERNMMFIILLFISIVAAFCVMNTLITVTVQKTREIGTIKALGASMGQIISVFVAQGMIIGVLGNITGLSLALLVVRFRNELKEWLARVLHIHIFPPEIYQFSQIPAEIVPRDVAIICLTAFAFCSLAALIPAYFAARLDPVKALRYE